jgi:hypothetical protein
LVACDFATCSAFACSDGLDWDVRGRSEAALCMCGVLSCLFIGHGHNRIIDAALWMPRSVHEKFVHSFLLLFKAEGTSLGK